MVLVVQLNTKGETKGRKHAHLKSQKCMSSKFEWNILGEKSIQGYSSLMTALIISHLLLSNYERDA